MIPAYKKNRSVLVVGGGIAGIQASLNLADMGYYVYLVEKSPAIGGIMPMLGKTFPTNDCSMCILSPKLVEFGRHPSITVLTGAEVTELTGDPGDFRVTVRLSPRGVDLSRCTACGECVKECPVQVDSEFNQGLDSRRAIYKPYPQAYPNAYAVDRENCIDCEGCATGCPNDAVNRHGEERTLQIEVGAVVLCPGFTLTGSRLAGEYRYQSLFPGVVTSLEFERLLSASGPLQGRQLLHLADGREVRKVAWIQCSGSREPARGRGYCSAVCCMYAVKQAMVAGELSDGPFEATVFYTDMRVFGKGFERFYRRAVAHGVRFIRARVSEIKGTGANSAAAVRLNYLTEGGRPQTEEFDLAVLSMGLTAPDTGILAQKAGLPLNPAGFCEIMPYTGVETPRPGVFAAGVFTGPKDIPDTVTQAGAAAAMAATVLGPARQRERQHLPERDVSREEPRTGVVVCCCGGNIDRVVKVAKVVESISGLPEVAWCDQVTYACSQDNLARLEKLIQEKKLNRLVVAACSPRTHRSLFQDIFQEAGLNRYLVEMANIREQCSWVHQHDREAATQKAADLVTMAVARAARLKPLKEITVGVEPSCLVVGGGLAGMSCAHSLAQQGYWVHLVEKEEELGGNARKIAYGLAGENVRSFLAQMVYQVRLHPLITVHAGREVRSVSGYVGNFTTLLSGGEKIQHGTAVIATGGQERKPERFLYGRDSRVVTLLELEQEMATGEERVQKAKSIVFIQCAGSREQKRPYCSRVCCGTTVRLALILKEKNPYQKIFVLYRDIVTYGFLEEHYQKARERGVLFVRYPDHTPPALEAGCEHIHVSVLDDNLGLPVSLGADLVALATPIMPGKDNVRLSGLFKVPLNEDGFFLEAHLKLAPVDTASAGVYLCGLAHAPKNIEESVMQGRAAAARAAAVLSKKELRSGAMVAKVQAEKCAGCLTCVRLCPFAAPRLENNRARIEPLVCRGCGVCTGECPNKAISLQGYGDEIFIGMLKTIK